MELINSDFIVESRYQEKINKNTSQCLICERKCEILVGEMGHCQTRYNHEGTIHSIVYGCNAGISVNPIEKKPLFHFFPGSYALTMGSFGCNFDCFWCQNHNMSHPEENIFEIMRSYGKYISPEEFVDLAVIKKCQGTSISFNEPSLLFEYSLDVFRLAKNKGLYNTYVSNGYMTEKVLKDLVESGLDAVNFDIKGNSAMIQKYCGVDGEVVWRNARLAKELGIHIEITTLLITKLNTDEETIKNISERICEELGQDTPYHISRFSPRYKAFERGLMFPTSEKDMLKAYNIAESAGLDNVYLGNLPSSSYEDTTCPKCSKLVIKRVGFSVEESKLDDKGNCFNCGLPIAKV